MIATMRTQLEESLDVAKIAGRRVNLFGIVVVVVVIGGGGGT